MISGSREKRISRKQTTRSNAIEMLRMSFMPSIEEVGDRFVENHFIDTAPPTQRKNKNKNKSKGRQSGSQPGTK